MKVQWQIANEFGKKILVGKPFTIQDELSHGFDAFDGSTMDADEAVICSVIRLSLFPLWEQ